MTFKQKLLFITLTFAITVNNTAACSAIGLVHIASADIDNISWVSPTLQKSHTEAEKIGAIISTPLNLDKGWTRQFEIQKRPLGTLSFSTNNTFIERVNIGADALYRDGCCRKLEANEKIQFLKMVIEP